MQNTVLDDLENESSNRGESESQTRESDNAWQLKSVSEEEFKKWETGKERYDEVIEYIREVDEILNLIKPFPRDNIGRVAETQRQDLAQSDSQSQSARNELDHLENIIKLVEQLKELQENNSKFGERTCYIKDLKKLREHKRKLKNEELELKSRGRTRSTASPEDYPEDYSESVSKSRKISSTVSEKLEHETEGWQHKRKSLCLSHIEGQNKSKVSKWTKVKEAFHWERTSAVSKPTKDLYSLGLPGRKSEADYRDHSPEDGFSGLDGFSPTNLPPPPPPPPVPPRMQSSSPTRAEDLLSVRPIQDFPSSSSSDRLDDFFSDPLAKGNKTSDAESSHQIFTFDDNDDVDRVVRKSSSGELQQHFSKEELTARSTKSNKTTWGKVKDIIQTRKDSLKKKPKKRGSDEFKKRRKLSTLSTSQFPDQFEDLSSPEEKLKNVTESISKIVYDFPEETPTLAQPNVDEKCPKKLMPALTVTLPSTEELRSLSFEDLQKREDGDDDKSNILGHFACQAQYCEDKTKTGKSKSGQNQRLSRWIKVKRVFLTSGSQSRPPTYSPVNDSSPTSQNKSSGFFSDMESDEVSSGEWIDDKSPVHEKSKPRDSESQLAAMTLIQEDIRKSYNELQKKLSQEFDQKLREWEMKDDVNVKPEDSSSKPKGEEGDSIPKFRKTRDSMAVPLPNLNDLSPEFKKKLNDWKKMKTSQSSSSVSSSATKDEIQGQNVKIRIGEWQPWRSRCTQKSSAKSEEDFSKKSEDGQKMKGGSRPPSSRRKDKEESDGSMGRRDSKKRDSVMKISHSRTSSGAESLISCSSTDKDGKGARRTQKMKDFQWVEKELQKIEREKIRLEQEKEKYLEKEARLEKMKRTIGRTCPTQEILVRTSDGFFRFKGISQKFTKKLYEWEKARGIAPEASTFALLEESAKTSIIGDLDCEGPGPLPRSKSTGSVPELSSALLIQTMAHHPSSLSLNDVDELKTRDESISSEQIKAESEEPGAIIVDVEDIVEETALLADPPSLKIETPVYTYASQETDQVLGAQERLYFSDDVTVMKDVETTDEHRDIELLENLPEPERTFRKTNIFEDTEAVIDRQTFSDDPDQNILVRNVKRFENDETLTKSDNLLLIPTTIDQKNTNHLLSTEEISQTKEEASTVDSELFASALTKCPKTFFEWTSSTERSDLSPRSLFESSEEWKPFSRSEHQSSHESIRTRTDPEVLKRKIKEKITMLQKMSMEGKPHTWKHFEYNYATRREEDSFSLEQKGEKIIKVEKDVDVVLTPQHQTLKEVSCESSGSVNVFVPTTRKIISPVKTTNGTTPSVFSYVIDDVKSEETQEKVKKLNPGNVEQNWTNQNERSFFLDSKTVKKPPPTVTHVVNDFLQPKSKSSSPIRNSDYSVLKKPESDTQSEKKRDIGIPPLPNSPKSFKKLSAKETAPSIRMIIAKYNQKISEHDHISEKRNESGSPTIWRSPVFGRRTQEKIDQYIRNGEVQKSASLDNMRSIPQVASLTPPRDQESRIKGILKSSSVGVMKVRPQNQEDSIDSTEMKPPTSAREANKENSPSVLRALKIQKAKEEFLSGRLAVSCDASAISSTEKPRYAEPVESTAAGKTHHIEVKVEDTERNFTKSVSVETIEGEKSSTHSEGIEEKVDSRPLQKSSSKFDISSIKSKFRKIRMRKEKDTKLNAVAALCRQSLFIEVPKSSDNSQPSSSLSKSCPSSPVMDRSKADKPNGPRSS